MGLDQLLLRLGADSFLDHFLKRFRHLEADDVRWVRGAAVGDDVSAGEVVVVISTTKAALEIEAPCDGSLAKIRIGEGELTEVGAVLGVSE